MNDDEIVRALRDAEGNNELDCEISELRPLLLKAADLIESMQAQLAEYDEIAAEYGIDGKTMLTLAKSQIRTAQDNIKLREQLAASQHRADAAVEDICKITDGECDVCKHYNPDKNTCAKPFVPRDECFEWRGPQENEKGERK